MAKKIQSAKKSLKKKSFPLVAIGASAGGLEAVTQLIRYLPDNLGMSFIYVQHLSPDYESLLSSLLSKSTRMKVQQATDNVEMKPNNFYIIPPNKEMSVADGHIKLLPRKKGKVGNLPIDIFFSSLAEKHDENVIGIVLSGTGSDGTKGLKIIKQEGGLTFAQDGSAKFSGMPESAIAEGSVDFVMPPKEIAAALIQLSKRNFEKGILKTTKSDEIENKHPDLRIILQLVYQQKGIDFSHYKMNTIKRRIIRRIQMHKLKTLKQYAEFLKKKDEEIEMLCQDLLINVTSFYRDSEAFSFLKTSLFPKLLKSKTPDETLRLWIPASSTGEEVYSIAMILLDLQSKKKSKIPIQIFATDLSASAIRKARVGEYSDADLIGVPSNFISEYFIKSKEGYRVGKLLRESCVFAQHNILYDPAFSNVDFISCCNLLIYLDATAQKKVISTFHYALRDNGYLMLSKSETIGSLNHLFSPINKKFKIFLRKKNNGSRTIPTLVSRFSTPKKHRKNLHELSSGHLPSVNNNHLGSSIDTVLLQRYMPTSVVINYDMDIIEVRGATENYLRMSSGKASLNILKMARLELAYELRNAVQACIKTKQTVIKVGIEMRLDSARVRFVNLEVVPLKIEGEEPLLLILFTEQQLIEVYNDTKRRPSGMDNRIKKLEEELASSRSDMLTVVHDHEATIEELQSANEEVVSSNEELRTLNEELETSKEEIQSTNEELLNAYQKLQAHTDQVEKLHKYSDTIMATIHNPMLVLDKEFHIKSANDPFYKHFRINERIENKKLVAFNKNQWKIPQLIKLLDELIAKKAIVHNFELAHTFKGLGEKIMLVNARLTKKDNSEQLIVLVIEDITERATLRNKEQKLVEELREANLALNELNSELTSFNYVSSHDLQEPLRKIKTFTNLILNEEQAHLSGAANDYFKRIAKSADKMQTLIQDLLSYSHISLRERKFEKIDIRELLEEVKQELADEIKEKNASIEMGKLHVVNVVGFQFHQLMFNLIGNALKYSSPKRAPHIIIKSKMGLGSKLKNEELLPDTMYCQISIEDNGIGFEPKFKDQIFKIFERLHDKSKYEGTGIGLAICKKIIKNHKGVISATSEKGKGSIFNIFIPANQNKS